MEVSTNLPFSIEPLQLPRWARGGHGQTLAGFLIPSPQIQNWGQKKILQLPDGDQLVCYLKDLGSADVYVFFHGLAGSIHSNYMRRAAALCESQNLSYVVVNHRGAGEGKNLAQKIYHSGRSDDAGFCIAEIRKLFGAPKRVIAVGFSLSANILLLLNGRDPEFPQADAYISVNAPLDLKKCSLLLRQGWNRIYDRYFIRTLRLMVEEKERSQLKFSSVYDFDEAFTAKAAGFESREAYYELSSSKNYVGKLRKPHIILMAQDDPFVAFEDYAGSKFSDQAMTYFSPHGGHLGYITSERTPHHHRRWLDYFLFESMKFLK